MQPGALRLRGARLARHLADWQADGVIDAATAERIRLYEAARPGVRVSGLLALLSAFAMALGLVAIVSANWERLPIPLKLGGHVALNLGLGLAAWRFALAGRDVAREVVLLLLSASTLGLVAHVGQSFQLQGSATGLVGAWLLLATPFTVALVRAGFHRALWIAGLLGFLGLALADGFELLTDHGLLGTTLAAILLGFAGLGALPDRVWPDPRWGRDLGRVGPVLAVLLVSLAQLGWHATNGGLLWHERLDLIAGAVLAGAGFAGLALAGRLVGVRGGTVEARWLAGFALGSGAWAAHPFLIPHGGSDVLGGLGLGLYWIVLAALALRFGLLWLYRLAVLVVAVRLFLVFVTATGGLLATGFGLVLAGALLILFGFLAQRAMAWGGRQAKGGE